MPKTFAAPAAFSEKEFVAIPMTAVESNQVAAIGYDAARKTLQATFTRGPGHVYQYPNVEPAVYQAFMAAESKGKYFGEHIKPLAFDKFPAPVAA
jgi:hypothetical protein